MALDGLGEGRLERLVGQARDAREQLVAEVLAALEGDDAQHALRRLVELVDAGTQHAAQAAGERLPGGGARDELLGEEGVALGATGDLVDGDGVVGRALEAGDELAHRRRRQRGEIDVLEPGDARPHGERLVERVPTVQVVGAIADDEADGRAESARQEQGEQVARGVVGPVHVLDDDEGGAVGAARREQGVDRLGHLAGVGRPAGPRGAGGGVSAVGAVALSAPDSASPRPGRRWRRLGWVASTASTTSGWALSRAPTSSTNGR